jgi:predicted GIY-YIG superfamily endonuclease
MKFKLDLSLEEIVSNSKIYEESGVYFLIKDNNIIYIGKTKIGVRRVCQHRDKNFDSFSFLKCQKEEIDIIESYFIKKFKPMYNG